MAGRTILDTMVARPDQNQKTEKLAVPALDPHPATFDDDVNKARKWLELVRNTAELKNFELPADLAPIDLTGHPQGLSLEQAIDIVLQGADDDGMDPEAVSAEISKRRLTRLKDDPQNVRKKINKVGTRFRWLRCSDKKPYRYRKDWGVEAPMTPQRSPAPR